MGPQSNSANPLLNPWCHAHAVGSASVERIGLSERRCTAVARIVCAPRSSANPGCPRQAMERGSSKQMCSLVEGIPHQPRNRRQVCGAVLRSPSVLVLHHRAQRQHDAARVLPRASAAAKSQAAGRCRQQRDSRAAAVRPPPCFSGSRAQPPPRLPECRAVVRRRPHPPPVGSAVCPIHQAAR